MVFQEILKDIVEVVGGGLGGLVIGRDGIALETYLPPERDESIDIQAFGVELVTMIGEMNRVSSSLGSEGIEEVSLVMPDYIAVMRFINLEYLVVVLLRRDGNLGKARWLIRREVPRLQKEF